MKVSELIEALKGHFQDAEVIISIDPEGNGFHKFADIDEGTIEPSELENYNIDSYHSDGHSDGECELEPGERKKFTRIICLWP